MKIIKTAPTDTTATATDPTDESGEGGHPAAVNPDLADLSGLVDQVDAQLAPPDPAMAAAALVPVVDYKLESEKMVDLFAGLCAGYCPPTEAVWTDPKKGAVAASLAPVLAKYKITMDALPCELVLIFVAGPPLYQTSKIIAMQMRAEQEASKARKAAAANDAGAGQVKTGETGGAPATAVHPQTALYKQ